MKALILAAGYGTRLKPVTDRIPKALVPVGGVPMLERVIDKVRGEGIDSIVVNTHWFADQVSSFIEDKDGFGIDIRLSPEKDVILDTGGAIRHAAPLLRGCGEFLVHNVDILSDISIGWLASHMRPGSLAVLAVREAEADRYLLFDEDMRFAGWTNVKTGEVKSPYPDFNPERYRKYSFCGIHILSESVFGLMEDWPDKFSIIDFYLSAADRFPIYGAVADGVSLIDIGTPEKLSEAEDLFGRLPKSE
ncbi:MAG: NTP transferase domain-containing protein [Bacteroidales bacterium]|nr:NTP transferase domain-containing protein [Bacteroidales bacterium]